MHRLRLFCHCGLYVAAALSAQERPPAVSGLVTDDSGAALPSAAVQFVPDAAPDLPSLRELLPLRSALTTTTDARGVFRVLSSGPGLLFVTTPAGLGGVVPRAWPQRAVRMRMRPMAEVRLADVEDIELWPARIEDGNDGERRRLPAMRGTAIRLPEGRYEIWCKTTRGFLWQSLSLRSGEHFTLTMPTTAVEVRTEKGSGLQPLGFADVRLLATEQSTARLLGAASTASLLETNALGGLEGVRHGAALDRTIPTYVMAALDVHEAPQDAHAYVVEGTAAGTFRPIASAQLQGGKAQLPLPAEGGNNWVLVLAKGRAARALPCANVTATPSLAFGPDKTLACTVRHPDGQPAAAVAITFEPLEAGPITALVYTDELGNAPLGPIAGAGVLRIDHGGYLPTSIAIGESDAAPVSIRLDAGHSLRGTATLADGTPLGGVAVSLRAPDGTMRSRVRATSTHADGTFAFAGLDDATRLVVFATATRAGRTFSARADSFGGKDLVLVLRDEDPELQPPLRRP